MTRRPVPPDRTLRRYWVRLDSRENPVHGFGYGVTAYDQQDAKVLLRERFFSEAAMPEVVEIIEDVDMEALDPNHVRPNMGVVVWRGVWYPHVDSP